MSADIVLYPKKRRNGEFEIFLNQVNIGLDEHHEDCTIIAMARNLSDALGFIGAFYEGPFMEGWEERNGLYVMDIYDWFDLWFANPPVRGRITAPPGFTPGRNQSEICNR